MYVYIYIYIYRERERDIKSACDSAHQPHSGSREHAEQLLAGIAALRELPLILLSILVM